MKDYPYSEIVEYLRSKSPEEAGGVVSIFKGRFIFTPCENTADKKQDEYECSGKVFSELEDRGHFVHSVVHSHPKEPFAPSGHDVEAQKRMGIDWLVVGLNDPIVFTWLTQKERQPLYGRKYVWHVSDCYTFVQDWYAQHNIVLDDFPHEENFWEKGQELYLDNFASQGFYEIGLADVQYGDLLLLCLSGNITGHAAVYLGGNTIAHHLPGRLSSRDTLGQFYMDRITKVIRHEKWKELLSSGEN